MSIQLYQFPISHYCEKVRFALDYKGLDYRTINLLPGRHRLTTTKIGQGSSVPVISHEGNGVQGSAKIITYLDENFPDKPLTPADPSRRGEAVAWEKWLDAEVGPDVRLLAYHSLMQHPEVLKSFFSDGVSWWSRQVLRFGYRKIVAKMRDHMGIDDAGAEAATTRVRAAVERLQGEYEQRSFLVGGVFTRADLAAAALLTPLFRPDNFPLEWPATPIEPLDSLVAEMEPRLEWARRFYREFR